MNTLITPQFNQSMMQLDQKGKQEVVTLFQIANELSRENLISSSYLTRIKSEGEPIYTLRSKSVRVFCAFDSEGNLLFLDVKTAHDHSFPQEKLKESETTLFDRNGRPLVYIATDDDLTIYSFNGEPLAYLDENNNIYGFNGKHLGWFEENIIWNNQGQRVGFTKATCPVFTQFESFKGFKQFKPFKGFKQFVPFKPFKGMAVSNVGLLDFLKEGRA